MLKVFTGWGDVGGSTISFINLVNALNEAGYESCLYAPHNYPNGKCRFQQTSGMLQLNKNDTLIVHYVTTIKERPSLKTFILSCHEQSIFPLKNINYKIFDKIQFVSEHQRQYHNIDWPSFIIPNVMDDLKDNIKPQEKTAGIIGTIDSNKNPHISIQRAIQDGFKNILIFGKITDTIYWQNKVEPLLDNNIVKYMGYMEDKQKMYDSITDCYFSSELECLPYVIGECKKTNTIVHGIEGKNYLTCEYEFNKTKIVEQWVKELKLTNKLSNEYFIWYID